MQSILLNNVNLLERFLATNKLMIPQLPSVMLITPGELDRYIQIYIDDVISQYTDWCTTTNNAAAYEDQLRLKIESIARAYSFPMQVMFDEYFEKLDQMVLSHIDDTIRNMMLFFGTNTVTQVTYLSDKTAFIENLGPSHDYNPYP